MIVNVRGAGFSGGIDDYVKTGQQQQTNQKEPIVK